MGNKASSAAKNSRIPIPNLTSTSSSLRIQIENSKKSRILQLKNFNIKIIPPGVEEICSILRNLDLSQNKISELPPFMGKFAVLKQLHVSANRLTNLPDEIGNLKLLEVLDLAHNLLEEIPTTISNCSSLTTIDISFNKFSAFPVPITQLGRLDRANLSDNSIASLPDEVENLNVTELDLSRNRLSDLNPNLSKCKKLKILRLDENCLEKEKFSRELLEQSQISLLSVSGNLFLDKEFQTVPGYEAYEQRFTAIKRKIL